MVGDKYDDEPDWTAGYSGNFEIYMPFNG